MQPSILGAHRPQQRRLPLHRTVRLFYDAFGRLVYRSQIGDIQSSERMFFSYDGNRCILELDQQKSPLRRYVYDERDQLVRVHQFSATRNAFDGIPINSNDGSPWLLFRRTMRVDKLPTAWAGDGASYYLQLLLPSSKSSATSRSKTHASIGMTIRAVRSTSRLPAAPWSRFRRAVGASSSLSLSSTTSAAIMIRIASVHHARHRR